MPPTKAGSTSQASASGRPGAQVQAPPVAPVPVGKTGIQVVWRGAASVPCVLYDETGTKALSPDNEVLAWKCAKDMGLWDAAPGKYQLKFARVADTMPPLPILVTRPL